MVHHFVFPQYTPPERIADLCIHAIGVTASVIALAALIFIGVESKTALWIIWIHGEASLLTMSLK